MYPAIVDNLVINMWIKKSMISINSTFVIHFWLKLREQLHNTDNGEQKQTRLESHLSHF